MLPKLQFSQIKENKSLQSLARSLCWPVDLSPRRQGHVLLHADKPLSFCSPVLLLCGVIFQWPAPAWGTAGLRNHWRILPVLGRQQRTGRGCHLQSKLPAAAEERNSEKSLYSRQSQDRAQIRWEKHVEEALDVEQRLHWLVLHPFVTWVNSCPGT